MGTETLGLALVDRLAVPKRCGVAGSSPVLGRLSASELRSPPL